MNDTADLLRAWVERSSEDAFAQLVQRHIDLVYSVAVRKVGGDTGLAAEITQTAFADLARKARTLRAEGSLAGWLHRHTCYLAATALRSELRRQAREQTAAAMHALENSSPADWSSVAPLLDDAVNALGDMDRRAIVLRFYEQRDIHSVGRVLGLGDEAAQKRIVRALEKLRGWLARRGVKSTSLALATLMTTQSVTAAPAGMAIAVTSAALSSGAAASAGTGLFVALIDSMTHTKAKLALTAALAATVAVPVIWQENAIARLRADTHDLADRVSSSKQFQPDQPAAQLTPALDPTEAARDGAELDRLRREVGLLEEQLAQTSRLANAAAAAAASRSRSTPTNPPPPGFLSALDAQDAGTATGSDLFQTMMWGMRVGDTNRLLQIGDWSSEEGQAGIAILTERFQRRQGPEAEREVRPLAFRTVKLIPLDNGESALIVEVTRAGGAEGASYSKPTRQAFRVRSLDNEWRFVMGRGGPQLVPLSPEQLRD